MGNEKNIETSLLHLHRGRSASSMSTPPKEKTTPTSPFHPTKPSSETQTSSSSSIQKAPRKWTSTPLNASEMAALDYSDPTTTTPSTTLHASTFSSSSSSTGSSRSMKKKPSYPPTPSSRLSTLTSTSSPSSSSYFGWLKTYLETHFSPNHVLTSDDVTPLFTQMETTLLKKNVAHEVTQHLHQAMVHDLVGQRVGWQSLQSQCTQTFMNVCDRLFMAIPPSSFLPSIQQKTQSSTTASSSFSPYVVCVCGVNGVGKSTQVAKLAYWCLSHQCSVLMVACDTFRSGAIEQLRTHVDRLTQAKPWTTSSSSSSSSIPSVALFAKEYGKDPSHIAKEAIQYAQVHHFQVVLLDTAGRMQNNEPLMRALAKLVSLNPPDQILFVGEATVGNSSLDQIVKFNYALKNYTLPGCPPREIDGFILTKFDIVGDQVGSVLNLMYQTKKPIVFLGTGQTYQDLNTLDLSAMVETLLQEPTSL
ncbi:hypothetical protein HMI54_015745 [Coelomomyces lativittatus]|nr:hypothetical protein HMI54_015745 [Coelomomyces lativittatus]